MTDFFKHGLDFKWLDAEEQNICLARDFIVCRLDSNASVYRQSVSRNTGLAARNDICRCYHAGIYESSDEQASHGTGSDESKACHVRSRVILGILSSYLWVFPRKIDSCIRKLTSPGITRRADKNHAILIKRNPCLRKICDASISSTRLAWMSSRRD